MDQPLSPVTQIPAKTPQPASRTQKGIAQFMRGSTTARSQRFTSETAQLYERMKAQRKLDREDYIRRGLLADPEKQTSLDQAITLRGECMEMCPEFERVEREHSQKVDPFERNDQGEIDAEKAVKRYHRSAAGDEQPLPSDIRPPSILKKSLLYLLENILANNSIEACHLFVGDRMRGIANDLTLQNSRGLEAVELTEIMARYYILVLHSLTEFKETEGFSRKQDYKLMEDNLKSLQEFYDELAIDNIYSPNECEFRAYFLLAHPYNNDQVSRLEQQLRPEILLDPLMQFTLEMQQIMQSSLRQTQKHRAGEVLRNEAGPNLFSRFFSMLQDPRCTPLIACMLENQFGNVRIDGMSALNRSFLSAHPVPLEDIQQMFGLDSADQTLELVTHCNLEIIDSNNGSFAVVFGKKQGPGMFRVQGDAPRRKSGLVEAKREGKSDVDIVLEGTSRDVLPIVPNVAKVTSVARVSVQVPIIAKPSETKMRQELLAQKQAKEQARLNQERLAREAREAEEVRMAKEREARMVREQQAREQQAREQAEAKKLMEKRERERLQALPPISPIPSQKLVHPVEKPVQKFIPKPKEVDPKIVEAVLERLIYKQVLKVSTRQMTEAAMDMYQDISQQILDKIVYKLVKDKISKSLEQAMLSRHRAQRVLRHWKRFTTKRVDEREKEEARLAEIARDQIEWHHTLQKLALSSRPQGVESMPLFIRDRAEEGFVLESLTIESSKEYAETLANILKSVDGKRQRLFQPLDLEKTFSGLDQVYGKTMEEFEIRRRPTFKLLLSTHAQGGVQGVLSHWLRSKFGQAKSSLKVTVEGVVFIVDTLVQTTNPKQLLVQDVQVLDGQGTIEPTWNPDSTCSGASALVFQAFYSSPEQWKSEMRRLKCILGCIPVRANIPMLMILWSPLTSREDKTRLHQEIQDVLAGAGVVNNVRFLDLNGTTVDVDYDFQHLKVGLEWISTAIPPPLFDLRNDGIAQWSKMMNPLLNWCFSRLRLEGSQTTVDIINECLEGLRQVLCNGDLKYVAYPTSEFEDAPLDWNSLEKISSTSDLISSFKLPPFQAPWQQYFGNIIQGLKEIGQDFYVHEWSSQVWMNLMGKIWLVLDDMLISSGFYLGRYLRGCYQVSQGRIMEIMRKWEVQNPPTLFITSRPEKRKATDDVDELLKRLKQAVHDTDVELGKVPDVSDVEMEELVEEEPVKTTEDTDKEIINLDSSDDEPPVSKPVAKPVVPASKPAPKSDVINLDTSDEEEGAPVLRRSARLSPMPESRTSRLSREPSEAPSEEFSRSRLSPMPESPRESPKLRRSRRLSREPSEAPSEEFSRSRLSPMPESPRESPKLRRSKRLSREPSEAPSEPPTEPSKSRVSKKSKEPSEVTLRRSRRLSPKPSPKKIPESRSSLEIPSPRRSQRLSSRASSRASSTEPESKSPRRSRRLTPTPEPPSSHLSVESTSPQLRRSPRLSPVRSLRSSVSPTKPKRISEQDSNLPTSDFDWEPSESEGSENLASDNLESHEGDHEDTSDEPDDDTASTEDSSEMIPTDQLDEEDESPMETPTRQHYILESSEDDRQEDSNQASTRSSTTSDSD